MTEHRHAKEEDFHLLEQELRQMEGTARLLAKHWANLYSDWDRDFDVLLADALDEDLVHSLLETIYDAAEAMETLAGEAGAMRDDDG